MCVCVREFTCVGVTRSRDINCESVRVSVFSVSINFSNVLYSIFIYVCHVGVDVCVGVCV